MPSASGCATGRVMTTRTVAAALDDYLTGYRRSGRTGYEDTARRVDTRVRPFFGGLDVKDVTPERLDAYVDARTTAGVKAVTIRNELAGLRRALSLIGVVVPMPARVAAPRQASPAPTPVDDLLGDALPLVDVPEMPSSSLAVAGSGATSPNSPFAPQPAAGPLTVADILATVERDYVLNQRRSLRDLRGRIRNHLAPLFGDCDPRTVSALVLQEYARRRQTQGARNATINRDVAILRRGFTLHQIPWPPGWTALKESPPREVSYTDEEFARLIAELAPWVRPPFWFARITGWRLTSEVLSIPWPWITFGARGYVKMPAGVGKNGDGRKFPFTPALETLLLEQRRSSPPGCAWVFNRDGRRLKNVRTAFVNARRRAGLDEKVIHDLRRTAAKGMHDRGVSETAMMKLIGWRDIATARRYNFRDDRDLYEAVKLLD